MVKRLQPYLKSLAKPLVALFFWAFVLWALLGRLQQLPNLAQVKADLSGELPLVQLLCGAGFFLGAMTFRTIRFCLLTRILGPVGRFDMGTTYLWSFMVGALTPMRLGEGVRIYWARQKGFSLSLASLMWLFERGVDLALLVCMLGGSLAVVRGFIPPPVLYVFLPLSVAIATVVFMACVTNLDRLPVPEAVSRKLRQVKNDNAFKKLAGRRNAAAFIFFTLVIWLCMGGMFLSTYGAFLPSMTFVQALLLVSGVNLSFLLAFMPGNAVGYQIAVLAVFSILGEDASVGLSASIIIHGLTILLIVILGIAAKIGRQLFIARELF